MTTKNIDKTRRTLEQLEVVEQLDIDGDTRTCEAIFRAIVDDVETVEEAVDDLDVTIEKTKYVYIGTEVVMR